MTSYRQPLATDPPTSGLDGDPAVTAATPIRPPARLGRYELLGRLAIGGMAEIHLARLAGEAGFEKIVVLKRLLPELVASRSFVEMFVDEGKLAGRLDHPNVCEVHELGRDGHEYFLVMPYLDGVPVNQLISRMPMQDRRAQLRFVASVIVQACAGLHHAHELRRDGTWLGLVHRDVSPSNLFVTTSGVVKVLDFGIAKIRGATAETEVGVIKGKAQYMAPEQVAGGPLDRRCDVFALGIVLFELVTGTRLFRRDSEYLVARAILEEPIPRADAVDPQVPAEVADVVAQALARRLEARFQDAAAFGAALEAAVAPLGGIASVAEVARMLGAGLDDELTAVRARQAAVLSEAKTRMPAPANARMAASAAPLVVPRTQRHRFATRSAVTAGLVVVAAIAAYAVGRGSVESAPAGSSAATVPAAVTAPAVAVVTVIPPPPSLATKPIAAAVPESPPRHVATPPASAVAGARHAVTTPGRISIDSTPYATITIDGHAAGLTPILGAVLAPGRHHVHARLDDGRVQDRTVAIDAGRAAPPLLLTW